MDEKKGFTIECTLVAKGVFILLLLFHHVFFGNTILDRHISTHLFSQETVSTMAMYSKICVGGFAFLSAYGMTCKMMREPKTKGLICFKRFTSFISNCFYVYCLAVIYRRFIAVQGIKELYLDNKGEFNPIYMIIDGLGLAYFFDTPQINVTWWYCTFAILLIVAIPAIYTIYVDAKVGKYLIGLMLLFSVDSLIVIVVVGVAFAYEGWFTKLDTWVNDKMRNRLSAIILCLVLLYGSYSIFNSTGNIENVQFWTGVLIAILSMILLIEIPILNFILKLLGKYSMFMFLTHTFIYYYFYKEYIYSFSDAYKIFLALLIISFVLSVLLTAIRKVIGYDYLIKCIHSNLETIYVSAKKQETGDID